MVYGLVATLKELSYTFLVILSKVVVILQEIIVILKEAVAIFKEVVSILKEVVVIFISGFSKIMKSMVFQLSYFLLFFSIILQLFSKWRSLYL